MTVAEQIHNVPTGIALLPDEVKLFDSADVRPFIGIEKSTDIVPVWYQMIKAPCPYYQHEQCMCTIYERRPVICRAYPFKVVLNYTRLGRCTALTNQTLKRDLVLPLEIVTANKLIESYDRTAFNLVRAEKLRLYNVETREWVAVT